MSKTNRDDQAFPGEANGEGLTKREYFSALICAQLANTVPKTAADSTLKSVCELAAHMADKLIEALNK